MLENKDFEGERGLEMIAHQKPRLLEFLRKNRSMKLNMPIFSLIHSGSSMYLPALVGSYLS